MLGIRHGDINCLDLPALKESFVVVVAIGSALCLRLSFAALSTSPVTRAARSALSFAFAKAGKYRRLGKIAQTNYSKSNGMAIAVQVKQIRDQVHGGLSLSSKKLLPTILLPSRPLQAL